MSNRSQPLRAVHLDLEAGAHGNDHQERVESVAIAQRRGGEHAGVEFGNDATVLVGDTPNDVAAGLAAGVRVIGVATDKTSRDELREAGATWSVDDVFAVRAVLQTASGGS